MSVTTDGSSVLSESRKAIVTSRDGGLCVLCGMDPTNVAHIISQNSGDNFQVDWIRNVAPALSSFSEDDTSNLFCLCPTHHRQFELGHFVFVPSRNQRDLMTRHELQDFTMREEIVLRGSRDPGRTFPELSDEFEYIPVRGGAFRFHVHNSTPYDQDIYFFDNMDHRPCPLLHFKASHVALMVQAESHLASVIRFQTPKGNAAETEVVRLLRLYQRKPSRPSNPPTSFVPVHYAGLRAELENTNSRPSVRISPSIPGSPPLTGVDSHSPLTGVDSLSPSFTNASRQAMPGVTPGLSMTIAISSQSEDNSCTEEREYAKERSITWDDLNNRPQLFGGKALGPWRFASAEDVCRSRRF